MNQNTIKNILFNIAALSLGFVALTYLPISSGQLFGSLVVAGIGLIAVKDYAPRRQLRFEPNVSKPIGVVGTDHRDSSLSAALLAA